MRAVGKLTVGVILWQVVVWQKAKVPDHRSALVATLGSGVVINLLPCHHRQEQPEVSIGGKWRKKSPGPNLL